jgi:hypothetical protein
MLVLLLRISSSHGRAATVLRSLSPFLRGVRGGRTKKGKRTMSEQQQPKERRAFGAREWCMACGGQIPPEGTEFYWAETVPQGGRRMAAGKPVPVCSPCGRRLTETERPADEEEAEEYSIVA